MFPKRLRREVLLLLGAKLLLLAVLYFAFFAPLEKPKPDSRSTQSHIIGDI